MAFNYDNGGAGTSRLGYKQMKPNAGLKYSPVASALSGYTPLSGTASSPRSLYAVAPTDSGGPPTPTTPPATKPVPHPPASERPVAPTPVPYDINTDPILQQITSYLGKSDEDARAAALKQRKDLLLGYGDSGLINSLLPGDTDLASAAGSNPTSTLAGLHTQRDRNSKSLTEALNQNNLFYSGNRIVQEQQAGQDYLGALAQALSGVQGGLGTIDSNLANALGANQLERIKGMGDATDRHKGETITPKQDPPVTYEPPKKEPPTPWNDPGAIKSDPAPTIISDHSAPPPQATLKPPTGPLKLPGGGGVSDTWSLAEAKPAPSVADLLKLLRG